MSQIDEESYERAIVYDTERILQRHLLPKSFLWNKPRIELLRSLPRDIEDMPGILCANAISPFTTKTTNNGPLGFGMFDMGGLRRIDVKGTRAETIITTRPNEPTQESAASCDDHCDDRDYPLTCSLNYQAAARRSHEAGLIDLNVHLPPLPLETALLTCQQHNILPHDPWLKHGKSSLGRVNALISAERAAELATMPFCWGRLEKDHQKYQQYLDLSNHDDINTNNFQLGYEPCLDHVGSLTSNKSELYSATKRRQKRKLQQNKIAKSSFRKWRLSVRVGGVSSRHSLIKSIEGSKNTPMHLTAAFPKEFQLGTTVTIEEAQKLDDANGCYLGTFDHRASAPHASMSYQAMENTKKELRAKKNIIIGRTRPIWSSFHQAGNNKIVVTSDLTGERLDAVSSKRPLQASVFIRLNGKILSTPKEEKSTNLSASDHKFDEKGKWSEEKILTSIKAACADAPSNISNAEAPRRNETICMFDNEAYLSEISEILKPLIANKKRKSNASIDDLTSTSNKRTYHQLHHIPPRFNCLPLEDGYIRVLCEKAGSLQPRDVHELLRRVSGDNATEDLCSICWSNHTEKPLKCIDCGVRVHETCYGHGFYLDDSVHSWRCAVCNAALAASSSQPSSLSASADEQVHAPSRKSRRTSRLPTRFTENSEVDNTVIRKNTSSTPEQDIPNDKGPIPYQSLKCALCPHSGKNRKSSV